MKEQSIQKKIQEYVTKNGGWITKVHQSGYTRKGIPDLIACIDGKFYAIETKTDMGKLSKHQEIEIQKVRSAGGIAFECYGWDDFLTKIKPKEETK